MSWQLNFARERERGTALVEFALVVLVLFLLIFGAIDFGRALYAYHFVANAAREGTRWASVRGSSWGGISCASNTDGCTAGSTDVESYVQTLGTGIGINPPQPTCIPSLGNASGCLLNVQVSWPGNGPSGSAENNGGCSTTSPPNSPGCYVNVQVTYPFDFIFPLMPQGTSPCYTNNGQQVTGSICMTSTSEMVISQ
jgi:hypothetical protein